MSVETPKNLDLIEKSTQEELSQLKFQVEKPQKNKKFRLEKTFSDKEKRNWKVYGYTLEGWEDYEKLEGIYHNMNEKIYTNLLPNRNFCDENWNPIKNVKLKKWEKVYIRIPDRDKVDSVPEMTMSDIKKLKEDQIKDIFASYQEYSGSDATPNKWSKYEHADKNWDYIMINGKKLYIQYPFSKNLRLLSGQPCILVSEMEWYVGEIFIWQYDWTNFNWVRYGYNNEGKKILERGIIKLWKEWFL